jgi:predicted phage-related endonuclease
MLHLLGLTPAQKQGRLDFIGGSDANTLLSGDAERINRLWLVKRRLAEDEDLSDVLQVQLGSWTEPFNRAWFSKQTGREVDCVGEERASIDHDFMAATLDGMTDNGRTLFEAKHTSAFGKVDEVLARYMPQLHHNMIVCGVSRAVLSVIFGNHKWEAFDVQFDEGYAAQLLTIEEAFWRCVQTGTPPIATEVKAPVVPVRRVDMTGSNAWAAAAADWVSTQAAAKTFAIAADALKALVEPDVVEAHGHGVQAKRNKAGAISVSIVKEAK